MIQHEEREQIALFEWAALEQAQYPVLRYLHHIPNGGRRDKITAAQLKRAGVKAGVPDICLPVPMGGFAGLYIELKYGANKPTKEQQEWLEHLSRAGYCVAVCYGCQDAIAVIMGYIREGRKDAV